MRKLSVLFLGFALSSGIAFADGGKDALPFVRIPRNAVTLGMAGAGTSSSQSIAWSSFSNSAVIPFFAGKGDIGASYGLWAPKTNKTSDINLGGAYKISDKFGISIGGAYQMGQEYEQLSSSGVPSGTFRPTEMLVNVGAGFLLTDNLSAGVNLRYASQKISSSTLNGFGVDAHVLYHIGSANISLGVNNAGPKVSSTSGDKFFPASSANLSGSYDYEIDGQNSILGALDLDYFFSGNFTAALGAQYAYKDRVFVRAGFHYGAEEAIIPTFASLGAGFKYEGFKIDLSFLLANENIGNTLSIGLGYCF